MCPNMGGGAYCEPQKWRGASCDEKLGGVLCETKVVIFIPSKNFI